VAIPLPQLESLTGIRDSKKLSAKERQRFWEMIQGCAEAIAWERIEHSEIDEINILQASRLAMKRAIENLQAAPDHLLIDGNQGLDLDISQEAIVGGDDKSPLISAASIVAKVTRDKIMEAYSKEFPIYQFSQHKGYPTSAHRALLKTYGPCSIHRKTFRGVRELIKAT
jgi:ribonuclease HII